MASQEPQQLRYSSPLQKLLLGNKYGGVIGRRVYSTCTVRIAHENVSLMLRPKGLDAGIVGEVFWRKPYEKHFRPQRGNVVFDVGAHVGCFTARSSRLVGEKGRVFAFEPSSENYTLLQKNVELNGLYNVRTFKLGLGANDRSSELLLTRHAYGNTTCESIEKVDKIIGRETIQERTLDSIAEQLKLDALDFLKIDAEGAEMDILRGAKRTLEKFHPKIVGEAHPRISDSGEIIVQYLKGFGYECELELELEWNPVFHAS